ncbi:flavin monoamine oxidase family protein [Reyranella sp.]|uniref:flavin monoamine oxidase family protein n=1 Tax=Reyranella sp. TaxID=1929291 RepID=UPI003D12A183
MALAPLLRLLLDLSRRQEEADSCKPVATEAPFVAIRRRAALSGVVGFASSLPLTGLAATARVAVVGAGLAGLAAARELHKAGLRPDIYEGNTRVGGRCFTARGIFLDGQLAENGGEYIDSAHREIADLAGELGLALDDIEEATPLNTRSFYMFGGKPYSLSDATRDWLPLYPVLKAQSEVIGQFSYRSANAEARRFDAMTIAQWVETYVPGGRSGQFGQLLETSFEEENGADADRLSALNVISVLIANLRRSPNRYNAAKKNDQRLRVRGGNDQIATLLAKASGDGLHMATGLIAITALPNGQVRLSFKRDSGLNDVVYDRVILAIPFSVMRVSVDCRQAGFRALKNRAIALLPIGTSTRIQLQFSRRYWTSVGCNGEMRVPSQMFQTTWEVTRAQPGKQGILNFVSGGTRALNAANLDPITLAAMVMSDVDPILPGLRDTWTGKMTKTAWTKDNRWSLGSSVYYPPGYQTNLLGIEGEREGNCFFAGEHTSDRGVSMNSAVQSGRRAASEVIASLR